MGSGASGGYSGFSISIGLVCRRIFTDSGAIYAYRSNRIYGLTAEVGTDAIHSIRYLRMALNTMNFYLSYRPMQVAVIDVFVHICR